MIKGKVIAIGQSMSGIRKSDGQPWRKQEYVIESLDQYPKKLAFAVMNNKIDEFNIKIGETIEIEVNWESREYNGRWYTDVTAWKLNHIKAQSVQQQAVYQQQAPQGYAPTVQPTTVAQSNPATMSTPTPQMVSGSDPLPF